MNIKELGRYQWEWLNKYGTITLNEWRYEYIDNIKIVLSPKGFGYCDCRRMFEEMFDVSTGEFIFEFNVPAVPNKTFSLTNFNFFI